MENKKIMLILAFAIILVTSPLISADLELDNVRYDPAVISAGDGVDIIVQYHYRAIGNKNDRVANPEYKFKVKLKPGSDLTEKYVTIEDSEGEGYVIYSGEHGTNYNDVFDVKISEGAPTGKYKFKLTGQWYKNGFPEGFTESVDIEMPVKKEGIVLNLANLKTDPPKVRPGDNFVEIESRIENSGTKFAKSVTIQPILPKGFESSYSDNNRLWAGSLRGGESKEVNFFVDLEEEMKSGKREIKYNFTYLDENNNKYQKTIELPFYVQSSPHLIINKTVGEGRAGGSASLEITIENTGEESAEAVDARLIKQSSQPFSFDVRSKYIGEIEPGEKAIANFDIDIKSNAEEKLHNIRLLLRSKGDSDEGDDQIYTFHRRAQIEVKKGFPHSFSVVGAMMLLGAGIFLVNRKKGKGKEWRIKNYVRMTAGSIVVITAFLAVTHSTYWIILTLFVGLNLFQSSFTGWCPLEKILKKKGIKN